VQKGIRVIPYIDDFFFACSSATSFAWSQAQVLGDLGAAGFIISQENLCQLAQGHVVKFLGFIVDTFEGIFCLTARQQSKLQAAITACL
jgi:hypothetical protein